MRTATFIRMATEDRCPGWIEDFNFYGVSEDRDVFIDSRILGPDIGMSAIVEGTPHVSPPGYKVTWVSLNYLIDNTTNEVKLAAFREFRRRLLVVWDQVDPTMVARAAKLEIYGSYQQVHCHWCDTLHSIGECPKGPGE